MNYRDDTIQPEGICNMPAYGKALSRDEKIHIIEKSSCTLNGVKAKITGAELIFAIVHNESNQSAEFSWRAVQRILSQGGNFTS